MRLELQPEGIGVTILYPAGMATRHLESSVAARPEGLEEAALSTDDLIALATGPTAQSAAVVDADYAVRNVLDDLERGESYIFTHGDQSGSSESNPWHVPGKACSSVATPAQSSRKA